MGISKTLIFISNFQHVIRIKKINMKLNYLNTYSCMFSLLDVYWEKTKLDDLGGLLGSMSQELLTDKMPIDKILFHEWKEISGEIDLITEEEGYCDMIHFLEKQTNWLDLNILVSELKKSFKNKDNYWLIWMKLFQEKKVDML